MAPCPDPKALPAPKSSLDWAAAGFSHAAAMVWWASAGPLSGFMWFQNWRMAPCPDPKALPAPRAPWIELRLALAMLRQWFDGISAGPLSGFMGFQTWRMAPCPDPKTLLGPRAPWIELRPALAMLRQWFDGLSAGPLSCFMGFQNWRMAPCPDPKALPAPKSSLDWAAAGFSHAAAMVWWAFGWPPVWFYGNSKLTDGPLPRSQSPPRAQELLGLSCGWALAMLRHWFDGLSAGPLSGFMGFQNWRTAPCPDPKALPALKSSLDGAAAGFSHAAVMFWWAFGWPPVWFYGISKLWRMATCPDPKALRAQENLGLSCSWL